MSDNAFPITEAQITALFMESVTYGIYLVTLFQCLGALLWPSTTERKAKSMINWPMLVVTILLGIFATLDVSVGFCHLLYAFVFYKGPGGALVQFQNLSFWINDIKTIDLVAQISIGDAMLIYRCWIVYGKNWKIVAPSILLWMGGSACGVVSFVTFATLKQSALVSTSKAEPFVDAMAVLTFCTNVLTTGLIVYRIWSVKRQNTIFTHTSTALRRQSRLGNIIAILVESAALYTTSVIIFAATYFAGSNASYGTSDSLIQIIGISFNLIIIRVNLGKAFDGEIDKSRVSGNLVFVAADPESNYQTISTCPLSSLHTRGNIKDAAVAIPCEPLANSMVHIQGNTCPE